MFRNFFHTVRRFKLASSLNVLGLSVAYTSFLIIMIQVQFERNFGTNDPRHAEIFRVETPSLFNKGEYFFVLSPKVSDYFRQNEPRVKQSAVSDGATEIFYTADQQSVEGTKSMLHTWHTDPSQVFEFKLREGSFNRFSEPNIAIISTQIADELFPNSTALGQTIYVEGEYLGQGMGHKQPLEVIGVYTDFPSNSVLLNGIYRSAEPAKTPEVNGLFLHIQTSDTAQIMANYRRWQAENQTAEVRLTSIEDIYYRDDAPDYWNKNIGNRTTTNILFAISLLVIVIASINFVNFSTALAPVRLKGLNTRLVFGQTKSSLRLAMVAEAVGMSICGFILALILVNFFNQTPYVSLIKASSTRLLDNIPVVITTALVSLIVGILAGLYPAYYSTRFESAIVLKGSGSGSRSGKVLRTTLIAIQYTISIGLIIGSLFVAIQNRYLRSFPTGFNKENIYTFNVSGTNDQQRQMLAAKLKQNPSISDVAFASDRIGVGYGYAKKMSFPNDTVEMMTLAVSPNFFDLMGIKLIQGRGFRLDDIQPKDNPMLSTLIFNAKAQQLYDIRLDSIAGTRGYAVGFVENLMTEPLYNEPSAMCFEVSDMFMVDVAYVAIDGHNQSSTLDYIKQCYDQLHSRYLYQGSFLDSDLEAQYRKESDLGLLITLFSVLAIVISLVGVFGLVVFETQYRRKEIGLRRINGATIGIILRMFNARFIWIVIVCFFVATPVALYGVIEWLSEFAYRTPIYWWVFVIALAIVLLITILTVTIQSWRAARENPVKSLKSE